MSKCTLVILEGVEGIIAKLPQYVVSSDSIVELTNGKIKRIKECMVVEDGGPIYNAISKHYTIHTVVKVFTCVWEKVSK